MSFTIGQIITLFFTSLLWIRFLRQIILQSDRYSLMRVSCSSLISVIILSASAWASSTNNLPSNYLLITIVISIVILGFQSKRFVARGIQSILRIISSMIPDFSHYPLLARSEESLKRNSLQKKSNGPLGEIIFLCMMSALVFARGENIIYLLAPLRSHTNTIDNNYIADILSTRGIIPIILHIGSMCCTCVYAYNISQKTSNTILGRSIGLLFGISLHTLFNIMQGTIFGPFSFCIILYCIALISYSLMRSDILYTHR